jgi:hypothetical protein
LSSALFSRQSKQLHNIQNANFVFDAQRVNSGGIHNLVFRTGDDEERDVSQCEGFFDPILARALEHALIARPDPSAARAAAKGILARPSHFDELISRRLDETARRVEFPVVSTEIAGIVMAVSK